MDFEVEWTEPAVADLEAILDHIAEKSPTNAERIGAAIWEHVAILRSFPFIGPRYPAGSAGMHREVSCKNYRIFYRVNEDEKRVEILTVRHGARRDPDLRG